MAHQMVMSSVEKIRQGRERGVLWYRFVEVVNGSLTGKVVLEQTAGRGEAGRHEGRGNGVGKGCGGDSCLVGGRDGL